MEAKAKGATIIHVDPRFTRTSAVSDIHATIRAGTDIVFLGALVNHVWSFAGDSDRTDVSSTFLQPFLTYTTKKQTTFTLNTESTYDWDRSQWTVPTNVGVAQLVNI